MRQGSTDYRQYLRFIAVLMISLVISIPFMSSNALAAIFLEDASGIHGVNMRRGQTDITNITVSVTLPTDHIGGFSVDSLDLIEEGGFSPYSFTTCSESAPYSCNYISEVDTLDMGVTKYCVCQDDVCDTDSGDLECPEGGPYVSVIETVIGASHSYS